MSLTTIQAINIAIEAINNQPMSKTNKEAIQKLNNMKKHDAYMNWTDEQIYEALYKWKKEHGRPPTTTNLCEVGMPGGVIIQSHFDMKPSLFLKQVFPETINQRKTPSNIYGFTCENDWLNCFKEQFNKHIDKVNSRTYNAIKDKNTPQWTTIAKYCKVSGWNELMKKANVKYPNKIETATIKIVRSHNPLLNQFQECLRQANEHFYELDKLMQKYS